MGKMHTDEVDTDIELVRRLLAAQFPHWAELPIEVISRAGTSNAMFRLGTEMVVRLPRIAGAAADVEKEHVWLPRLAPQLPAPVPVPLGQGEPGEGYPWQWSVYGWLAGANPAAGHLDEPQLLTDDLASFVTALRRIDPTDGPASYRSEPLAARDAATRLALAEVDGLIDATAALRVWEGALHTPAWTGAPAWIHADLQPGNLLVSRGRLSGVIDFGCLGLGDPAVDLLVAWYVLPREARPAFSAAVAADEAMWIRGRAWALSVALLELRYYRETNPVMAGIARHVVGQVLADDVPPGEG